MGNIVHCKHSNYCCDEPSSASSPLTHKDSFNPAIQPVVVPNKNQHFQSIIKNEYKRTNEHLSQSNVYGEFCKMLKNVLKIQHYYRRYRSYKLKVKNKKNITFKSYLLQPNNNSNINFIISNKNHAITTTAVFVNNLTDSSPVATTSKIIYEREKEDTFNTQIKNNLNHMMLLTKSIKNNELAVNKETTILSKLLYSYKINFNRANNGQPVFYSFQTNHSFFSNYCSTNKRSSSASSVNSFYSWENLNPKDIHGNFIMKSKKKLIFQGTFDSITHKKKGFGIVHWEDGSTFHSIFQNNHAEGFGRFNNISTKSIYAGEYVKNCPKGYGTFLSLYHNIIYEGYWDSMKLNGIGIELNKDEIYFQGEFLNCLKNGIGLQRWEDGTVYQGEWKDNKMSGYGIISFNDGNIYKGQLIHNQMNGYGEFVWQNGSMYIGGYEKDIKHGFGIFCWEMNPIKAYVGFWKEGKRNGVGISIVGNIIRYQLWNEDELEKTFQNKTEAIKSLEGYQIKYSHLFHKNVSEIFALYGIQFKLC